VPGPASNPEYLPLRVAEAAGDFAAEKLTVRLREVRAEALAAQALARGEATVAATSLDAALQLGHTGNRPPRLVFGLTATPPVALLVASAQRESIRSVADLAGKKIAVPAPGTPAERALLSVLERARVPAGRVSILSYGERGVVSALGSGAVAAAMVGDPQASRLVEDGHAVVLADLRRPEEAARALGDPTVNAALFVRADTSVSAAELTAIARALLRAMDRLARDEASTLAATLPEPVVDRPDAFALRLRGAREVYLRDGRVSADRLRASIDLVRARSPIPDKVQVPRRAERLLLLEPLEEALRGAGR
jgi:NitT/TauT family transport system substrate-binding protein